MFSLGNFAVSEILYATAQDFSDNLLYVLDQLSNASIEVSSDPTEITDKNGNVIKTIYKSKTATLSGTNALLSPVAIDAASGEDAVYASTSAPIEMPKMVLIAAGGSADISDVADEDTIKVIGLYGNGANGAALVQGTGTTPASGQYIIKTTAATSTDPEKKEILVPPAAADEPVQYLVKYTRNVTSGIQLSNKADSFPETVRLTLYVAIVDPCDDSLRAAYVYAPSAQADPSMTISLDSESTEMDITYNLQTSYCSGSKDLYFIYFPDEDAVVTASVQ